MSTRRTSRGRRWLAASLFGLFLLSLWPSTTQAANVLLRTTPTSGSTLAASPRVLELVFRDPIGTTNLIRIACDGRQYSVRSYAVREDKRTLQSSIAPIPAGSRCTVSWTVVDPKTGAPNGSGSFTFAIAGTRPATSPTTTIPKVTAVPSSVPAATATTTAKVSGLGAPLGLARLITNLGLAALFGALVLIVWAWPEGVEYVETENYLKLVGVIAVAGSLLTVVMMAGQRNGGGLTDGLSPSAWTDLTDSAAGVAALLRLLLAVGCAWIAFHPDLIGEPQTQTYALAVPGLALMTLGATRGVDVGAITIVAGAAHALAMGVWVGALALLSRVVLAGAGDEDLVHAIRGFRRISTLAIIGTVATGLVLTYQLDWGDITTTAHGRVVVLKLLAVIAVIVVGLAARQFIHERLSRVDRLSSGIAGRLRRAISIEAMSCVAILALTAVLTSMAPAGVARTSNVELPALGSVHEIVNAAQNAKATIRMTERVGPNAVLITIITPKSGLKDVKLRFLAPAGSTAAGYELIVPLTGAGSAMLDRGANLKLNAPGVWTVVMYINGTLINSVGVDVQPAT